MKKITDKQRVLEVFNLISEGISQNKLIGKKMWGNPSGAKQEENVYEVSSGNDTVWVSFTEWLAADSKEINRKAIITAFPDDKAGTLGQVFEVIFPYNFSKLYSTRLYEDNGVVEIRNYGKFTIGQSGLKRECFFDYLLNNGLKNEVLMDDDNNKYINILSVQNNNINNEYLVERIVFYTKLIKQYKDYMRNTVKAKEIQLKIEK